MQSGYDLYPSKYNFKYFIRLQSPCSYQGKLQTNYAVLTFCDFKHRIIVFTITDSAMFKVTCKLWTEQNINDVRHFWHVSGKKGE